MAIVISGVNNNDKITASDGTIDLLSGVNYVGVLTAPHINVGNSIQLGNAGIITATTLVGNVTGNVNHTSNLLLQISGSEKLRIANSGAFGLNGTNYGSSGQVLTSQGSGSSPIWSTITGTTINSNADNRIITGSGTANTLNGESNLVFNGTKLGVNQNSPYSELDVTSSVEDSTGTLAAHGIRLGAVGATDEQVIPITAGFKSQQDRARAGIGFISKISGSSEGYAGAIGFYTRSSADGNGLYRSDEKLRIASDGDVGIGTNSPLERLHVHKSSATGPFMYITNTSTGVSASDGIQMGFDGNNSAVLKNNENTDWIFYTNSSEKLRITSAGVLRQVGGSAGLGSGDSIGKLTHYTIDPTTPTGVGDVTTFETTSSTSNGSDYRFRITKREGSGGGSCYLDLGGNSDGSISFGTNTSGSGTERLRIDSDGDTHFTGQRHRFNFSNSGGVGPYLSLRNTSGTTGSITGICFGIGGSSADLDGTDYGEGQIKVYNDSGNFGNMEFNLHVNANRSFMKIVGNGQGYTGAGSGTEGMRGGVAFGNAGLAIDRSWTGQPGIHVFNQNVEGDTDQGTFRFHGWNTTYASYPNRSGADFSVNVTGDGSGFSSDERKKTGITTITNALNTVAQLRGVSYKFVNSELNPQTHMTMDSGTKLGFVAQEVIPLLPSIVIDAGGEKAVPHENGWCDRYCIDYGSVTALLAEAIKELKIKNEALELRVAALEGS